MAIVSQVKFGKLAGRHRSAINQRIKRGTLMATATGKLDTEDPINAAYIAEIEFKKKEDAEDKKRSREIAKAKKENKPEPPPPKPDKFSQSVSNAKQAQEVLKYKKLELEVKVLQGELVRRDTMGESCFGYLGALNLNIMEMPQSFLDELEGAILNKEPRSAKMAIITKPICEAINTAVNQIEKKLKAVNEN